MHVSNGVVSSTISLHLIINCTLSVNDKLATAVTQELSIGTVSKQLTLKTLMDHTGPANITECLNALGSHTESHQSVIKNTLNFIYFTTITNDYKLAMR